MPFDNSNTPLTQLPNTYRAFYGSFTCLNSVQKQSISPILQGKDLILQSATGSGKTEAVLAPAIERMIQAGCKKPIIYIVPTRALALDLTRRFTPVLTDKLGLRLGIRTGDVKRFPGGRPDLLLTTPESLDVMLGSSNADIRQFFKQAGAVIIDEVHSFVYTYRGRQLVFLLKRMEYRKKGRVQRIALSATIEDFGTVVQFFNFSHDAIRLTDPVQRHIIPHLVHLKDDTNELTALVNDLYKKWEYRKILIFANSRGACDRIFGTLNEKGHFKGRVKLHYSNLKAKERRRVEESFRRNKHALCVATSTLELGIDIGDVDGVVLYEPPDSVSTFLQRIGRGNRRTSYTHFWGISRGSQSGMQLLRFLGLVSLARGGTVEQPKAKKLNSVIIQQILSCLYEKKQISLPALQALFSEQAEVIGELFSNMIKQRWLRALHVQGLYSGGWRYRNWFLERKIWSNFPESPDDYTLEVNNEAIADIPASIIRQLEPGDCVRLTGKRLKVLDIIENSKRKRLLTEPSKELDEKEIFWLGSGFQASYEVAQSIKALLSQPDEVAKNPESGLFSRTCKLFNHEVKKAAAVVTLENGLMVGRCKKNGMYRYWTFLGSIGNLVLQWCIEHGSGKQLEEFTIISDETGLECSHLIDFRGVTLPETREKFEIWVGKYLKPLKALVSLNAFARFLPSSMLVEELSDFLFDQRIGDTFFCYRTLSSTIISGDPKTLKRTSLKQVGRPLNFTRKVSGKPLLDLEKERWKINDTAGLVNQPVTNAQFITRSLTGTMIGDYVRHNQCERCLGFKFLPDPQVAKRAAIFDKELTVFRKKRGELHKTYALTWLASSCDELIKVNKVDTNGELLTLSERSKQFINCLKPILFKIKENPEKSFIISQAVLIYPDCIKKSSLKIKGLAFPDFIRVNAQDNSLLLEVGDIKDSRSPRYHQKWQVAFYAFLLKSVTSQLSFPFEVKVASFGSLVIRHSSETRAPLQHRFDLTAYLASLPALLEKIDFLLQRGPFEAMCRIESHCTTCPCFNYCYIEALTKEDIVFLPGLTRGTYEKLRKTGFKNIKAAQSEFFTNKELQAVLSPYQKKFLKGIISAFTHNRIELKEETTRLFPSNVSTVIFFHILENPFSDFPSSFAWEARDKKGKIVQSRYCTFVPEEKFLDTWCAFINNLLQFWDECCAKAAIPHLFYFDEKQWRLFQEGEISEQLRTFIQAKPLMYSSLGKILSSHFYLPVPGRITLYSLERLLNNSKTGLKRPESMFHTDSVSTITSGAAGSFCHEKERAILEKLIDTQFQVKKWIDPLLKSEWEHPNGKTIFLKKKEEAFKMSYLYFIEEEKRLRQEDIQSLQSASLPERVERFRSIGPLKYFETLLDDEGSFLYGFRFSFKTGRSKFREGDFLKLSPVGADSIQDGYPVILHRYYQNKGEVWLRSRKGGLLLNKHIEHSLEEDISDFISPKLVHIIQTVFSKDNPHFLARLFKGELPLDESQEGQVWVEQWLTQTQKMTNLNFRQKQALTLPFRSSLGLIEGPPGTGKTHLLGWTIIALMQMSFKKKRPMRIVVSALTHQAIDQVLKKIAGIMEKNGIRDFDAQCFKWGRAVSLEAKEEGGQEIKQLSHRDELFSSPYVVLGATGFGLYQLFSGGQGRFPQCFDWVIFDEASQILIPQAFLSLVYGKGRFLFYGDVKQLPPIVLGSYPKKPESIPVSRSVLSCVLKQYSKNQKVTLNRTYRMNREICSFPATLWYEGDLYPAKGNADFKMTMNRFCENDLLDKVLNPERPVTLLLSGHTGMHQKSEPEAEVVAELITRLIIKYGVKTDQIGIISPHRAQNNGIKESLITLCKKEKILLPVIDTVERMQGAERDLIIFSVTTSDLDHVESEFLNNPNRFNVAMTRARKKLIVIGSRVFFSHIAHTDEALELNGCFKLFLDYCEKQNAVFVTDKF